MTEAGLERLLSRAQAFEPSAHYDEALQDLETVLRDARRAGLAAFEAAALLHRGRLLRIKGELDTAEESARAGASVFASLGDKGGQARALLVVAEVLSDRASMVEFEQVSREAMVLSQQIRDPSAEARSLTLLAVAYLYQGRLDQSALATQQALEIYSAIQDSRGIATTQLMLGRVEQTRGNVGAALRSLQAASEVFGKLGEQRALSSVFLNVGQIYLEQRDIEAARVFAERGVGLTGGSGDSAMYSRSLLLRAQVDLELGVFESAIAELRQAEIICREHGLTSVAPEVYRTLAQALLGVGQVEEARETAERAVENASSDDPYSLGTTNLVRALVNERIGDAGEAERSFRTALGYLQKANETFELGWGHSTFGSFLLSRGLRQEGLGELLLARGAFVHLQAYARVLAIDAEIANA